MAPESIADTLRRADGGVTTLDDKVDVENDAIFVWLKGHSILRGDMRHYALVTEPGLPQPWQATAMQFTDVAQATTFLQGLHAEAKTKPVLEKAVASLPPPPTPAPSPATLQVGLPPPSSKHGAHHRPAAKPKVTMADLIARIAPELVSRHYSLIPVTRMDSRFIGKTDPAVYARVNGACGTAIQFDELSKFEGGQWLRGYVPMRRGMTVDSSGMTIATGFDIGQWYAHELTTKLGLEGVLKFKLNLFTAPEHRGHIVPPIKPGMNSAAVFPTGNFARMSKQAVAKKVAETAPVPMLDKGEADKVDEAVHTFVTNQAKDAWNDAAKPGVPRFEQLPSGWQTAVMSRFFQQGPGFATREPGASFFEAATAGDWARATALFRGMSSSPTMAKYADRLAAETRLLSAAMPPPVKPPGPPAAPAAQPVRR